MTTSTPVLSAHQLSKRLGAVQANDAIDLSLYPGEIHALLGENGAGKTTLLNLLSGLYEPDSGEIRIDGHPTTLASPAAAIAHGIGTVHQHFTLVPNLSITENLLLGAPTGFLLSRADPGNRVSALMTDLGLDVPPETEIRHLSLGQRQRVEIVKALARNSTILLLDEPTSVLSPKEATDLFAVLERLRDRGVAIVLVTHKLEEALAVSDRITVLRDGKVAGTLDLSQPADRPVDPTGEIVSLMFGERPVVAAARPDRHPGAELLLRVDAITALGDRGETALHDLSLVLKKGEVYGVAGVDGNGQQELAEVLAGQRRVETGKVTLDGIDLTNRGPRVAREAGIAYVTDDRLGEGTVPSMSIADNLILKQAGAAPFSRRFWLDRAAIEKHADRLIEQFEIRTSGADNAVSTLSGGNVQRLLLARELASDPRLLICNKPTYGLDLATAQNVLQLLHDVAAEGRTVLLFSPELDDLLAISDRIGVMFGGQIVATLSGDEATPDRLGRLMTAGNTPTETANR